MGKCEVSIPRHHQIGELEGPSLLRFEFRENPERHVILLSVQTVSEAKFYSDLGQKADASSSKDIFVFVHGYNVGFDDAARRAAQLAYDLPYTGIPVLFSWPSQNGMLEYTIDETNVEWAVPHLEGFISELVGKFGASRINLIAHSMGNRALTAALRGLANRQVLESRFREIILAAPDIDADIFRRDIAPVLAGLATRVTLYASSNDEALKASKQVHGSARAGESGDSIVVVSGIDTIDVSGVDLSWLGHGYYGGNVTVLKDLFHLLDRGIPPEQRKWLAPTDRDGLKFWVLQRSLLEETAVPLEGVNP
jgi:esterase/lipase superfamily enzyme